MPVPPFSRREFPLLAGAALNAAARQPLTAQQVVSLIQERVGVPWRQDTVDTIKAGAPETPITGIATTFIASLDVLRRAAAAGRNMIITHEPTFYNHLDRVEQFSADPVFAAKRDFIHKHNLVVFRFHDHWHLRKPDAVLTSLASRLGWENRAVAGKPSLFVLPETTLAAAAAGAQHRLNIRTIRIIGDPSTKFTRAGLFPGAPGLAAVRSQLDYEVYFGGETTEWEGISYATDMVTAGIRKGMILLGHQVSEEPGMKACADWLKPLLPGLPIEWLPSGEPFWRPA